MNFFGNVFGGRKGQGDGDCACTLVWIILLLSICGNCIEFDCTTILIILLLLSCNNGGFGEMGGCRG
ncbi:MAG: hypothetical protein J6T74_00820 [Clostridia bacterium]|nr:hypothetical protein [Clostridia bacterium]